MPPDPALVRAITGLLDDGDEVVDKLVLIARRNRPLDEAEPTSALERLRAIPRRWGRSVPTGQLADTADALDELVDRWRNAAAAHTELPPAPDVPELYRAADPSTVAAAIHNDLRGRLADLHRRRAEAVIGRSLGGD